MNQALNITADSLISQESQEIQELSLAEIDEVNGGRIMVYLAFNFLSLDHAFAVLEYMNY